MASRQYVFSPCLLAKPDTSSGYSPLDMTLVDPHWGTLNDWVETIDSIHAHNMYLMVDFTIGTMSDLIGFSG